MSVTVRLPGALRDATGGETKLTASGGTLREVIAEIDRRHPGFASRVLDEGGALRSYVNVYIGEDDARSLRPHVAPLGATRRLRLPHHRGRSEEDPDRGALRRRAEVPGRGDRGGLRECGVSIRRIEEAELQRHPFRSDKDRELTESDVTSFIRPIGAVIDRDDSVYALDRSFVPRRRETEALAACDLVRK